MTRGIILVLVASHAIAIGAGWMIARAPRQTSPYAVGAAEPARRVPDPEPRTVTREPNPILRASGADFEAAWHELLRGSRHENGDPGGLSLELFLDWCRTDPEGAILGLADLHSPRFAHNFLSNATQSDTGGDLAPALVRHWRRLRLQKQYKVEFALAQSLRRLAKTDSARTAGLVKELPPGVRKQLYRNLFDQLDTARLESLVERLPQGEDASEEERQRIWQSFAKAIDRSDPDSGLFRWLRKSRDPVAERALAEASIRRSVDREDWSGFLDAISHDGDERASEWIGLTRDVIEKSLSDSRDVLSSLRQACEDRGRSDWVDHLGDS